MIPAVIVGAFTAWYLGIRAGVIAAVASFAAIIVGGLVPGMTLPAYGLIVAWCAVMYFFGPTLSKSGLQTSTKPNRDQRGRGLRDNPTVQAANQVGAAATWAKRAVTRIWK
ncbi:MAG: hypothetical protein KBG15_20740 [Kofleriaceae bacterium]|nr:hypothetical protein [Kofleriaceae bacterium]